MHNAINLIASQREDLRSLDDFPWPKEFKRAETTGASGIRVFLDKFCLLDGAQWEGNLKGSGGFVGALLKSLVFLPVFSANGFTGSLGQMAQIWNPIWDCTLSSTPPTVPRCYFVTLQHAPGAKASKSKRAPARTRISCRATSYCLLTGSR